MIGASNAARREPSRSRLLCWRALVASVSALSEAIVSEKDGELEEGSLKLCHPPARCRVRSSGTVADSEQVGADTEADEPDRGCPPRSSWGERTHDPAQGQGQRDPSQRDTSAARDADGVVLTLAFDPRHVTSPMVHRRCQAPGGAAAPASWRGSRGRIGRVATGRSVRRSNSSGERTVRGDRGGVAGSFVDALPPSLLVGGFEAGELPCRGTIRGSVGSRGVGGSTGGVGIRSIPPVCFPPPGSIASL